MAIKIVIELTDDPNNTITHELDQSLITFGRSKSCHIELDHPEISRRHFIIKFEDNGYSLFDQNSRHGTVVDGNKVEPEKAHLLGKEHAIEVPGFIIKLWCDGEKPRLERTTVVARQLLDDLLQGEIRPRDVPRLCSQDGRYVFKFADDKTTFVLGSHINADFVVTDDGVTKKHVSFIRDIFGIRVMPTAGSVVLFDNVPLMDAQMLMPKTVIKIGPLNFVYADSDTPEPVVDRAPSKIDQTPISREIKASECVPAPKREQKSVLQTLDRMFVFGVVAVCIGAAAVMFSLA